MNQNAQILTHLRKYGSITPMEAMSKYGCMRLGARVYDLKEAGHKISKVTETGLNRFGEKCRYARYTLVEDNEVQP